MALTLSSRLLALYAFGPLLLILAFIAPLIVHPTVLVTLTAFGVPDAIASFAALALALATWLLGIWFVVATVRSGGRVLGLEV